MKLFSQNPELHLTPVKANQEKRALILSGTRNTVLTRNSGFTTGCIRNPIAGKIIVY
jgi:hypothetical protein